MENIKHTDMNPEKNKVEAILSQMTDGIVAFDQSGEMIHSNSAARELSGVECKTYFHT